MYSERRAMEGWSHPFCLVGVCVPRLPAQYVRENDGHNSIGLITWMHCRIFSFTCTLHPFPSYACFIATSTYKTNYSDYSHHSKCQSRYLSETRQVLSLCWSVHIHEIMDIGPRRPAEHTPLTLRKMEFGESSPNALVI